jgi:outer membrane protein OmpA-like peptidoglycan-associated protein
MGHDRKQGAPGNHASREGVVQRQVAPGKQTLTAALSEQMTGTLQRKAGHDLDGVATKLTATATLKCKLGGAADGSETSPATIAQARATAAKAYLVGKGVTATQIDVESYGSDWAKEKTTAGADEPKNRRVQVWVHP